MNIEEVENGADLYCDAPDRVSVFPVVKRGASGEVLPSRCRVDVEVVPDVEAPGGYTIRAKTLYTS